MRLGTGYSSTGRIPGLVLAALVISLAPLTHELVRAQKTDKALSHPPVKAWPSNDKRWALIIGIDNYDDENITPLRGATNDANVLAQVLEENAGFDENQVIVLTNEQEASKRPTRNNILKYLSHLKSLVPKDGLLLISFSGHGIEREQRAFLIPRDAVYTEDIDLLEQTAVSVSEVTKGIKATGVNQVVILLDACRSDPLSHKAGSANPLTESYLRAFNFDIANKEVTAFAILYATDVGARAYEDVDRKAGYFTLAVAEALRGNAADPKSGEVTLQNLVKYVQRTVPVRVAANLGATKEQKPFAVIGGYKADELVLSIGQPLAKGSGSYPVRSGWVDFRVLARKLVKYDYVDEFSEGLARVRLKGKEGFINQAGDLVIAVKYDEGCACNFSEGLAVVKRNEKWGYVDKNGNEVLPAQYERAASFKSGLAVVKKHGKEGMIDKAGRVVIPFKYDNLLSETEGLIGAEVNDKAGFIDRTGAVVIPFEYDDVGVFAEGLAAVKSKDKWGFINKKGRVELPIDLETAESFSDGFASVGVGVVGVGDDTEYARGLMDKRGNLLPLSPENVSSVVTPLEYYYNWIDRFSEGLASVFYHGKQGFIDKRGTEVIPLKYDGCECGKFENGIGLVSLNEKFGFVDRSGREVIPIKYDEIWTEFRRDGFIGVKLNGKKGFVDLRGNEYWDMD
ncbi:MAG TPA: WG repeat-containing protein [Pyrinomonadaceae bacterium]|nr:WG repeat-containing protein [Pyrinomonadaceae bacterium]